MASARAGENLTTVDGGVTVEASSLISRICTRKGHEILEVCVVLPAPAPPLVCPRFQYLRQLGPAHIYTEIPSADALRCAAMTILGVSCSASHASFSLVEARGVVDDHFPARMALSPALPTGRAMLEFIDHLAGELQRATPSAIVIYRPPRLQRPYSETSRRAALETLVTVAAAQRGIDTEILPDARIRSRLGLPRSGSLGTHAVRVFPSPIGSYWAAGRSVAALTAAAALD